MTSNESRPLAVRGAWSDRTFRWAALEGAGVALGCLLLNVLFIRGVIWWPVVWAFVGYGLFREARQARRRLSEEPAVEVDESPDMHHVAEASRLREAVEALAREASEDERALLGDVVRPVRSLEERVARLVTQAREIDAALRLHDAERVREDVEASRRRLAELEELEERDDVAAAEERSTLDVLERQLAGLERVRRHRDRIDARLRACVGLLRSLHLDLVELRSSELEGQAHAMHRLGEQVREVSRGVDALASAADDLALDELGRFAEPAGVRSRHATGEAARGARGRRRERS